VRGGVAGLVQCGLMARPRAPVEVEEGGVLREARSRRPSRWTGLGGNWTLGMLSAYLWGREQGGKIGWGGLEGR